MSEAVSITWQSLKDLWEDFVLLVALSVLWALSVALPLLPLFLFGQSQLVLALVVGIFLLVPMPIVSGGLLFVTNQISRGKSVSWETFSIGVRRYWRKSLIVAVVNVVVLILTVINIQFYATLLQGTWTNFALAIWLLLAGYWLLIQFFWFPMILELESESVLTAFRNALLMGIVTPGFSIVLSIIIVLVIVICVALTLPAILFMAALLMLIANHATRSRLAFAQKKTYKPGTECEE
jgi:hypothetical protein